MKTTSIRIDTSFAIARATTVATYLAVAFKRLVAVVRALRNRREVCTLEDFTPEQLADIGLTRDDLRYSLKTPWYDDPSVTLSHAARRRRAGLRRLNSFDL
jgi:uncharacterized protein YjiS (DUF1127 family)